MKHKLVDPIINVLFLLMSTPPEEDVEDDYFQDESDSNSPMTCATQTLDLLALHVPADKLLPPLVM